MPYSNAWGATIEQDVPNPGDVTMTLTDGGVTCSGSARTEIGAKDALAHCFMSQPGPAPRIWQLRYRIARAITARAKWAAVRAVLSAGNQNRLVTRPDPDSGQDVTRTAAEWVVIMDAKMAQAQGDWDRALAEARGEGLEE